MSYENTNRSDNFANTTGRGNRDTLDREERESGLGTTATGPLGSSAHDAYSTNPAGTERNTGLSGQGGMGLGSRTADTFGSTRHDELSPGSRARPAGSGQDRFDTTNLSDRDTNVGGYTDSTKGMHTEPTMGDKVKGGAEKMMGKVTRNPEKQEKGMERQAGLRSDNDGRNPDLY